MGEILIECQGHMRTTNHATESFAFSGGELQLKIDDPQALRGDVTVTARIQSSDDLVRLVLFTDILDSARDVESRTLVIPYFPYARQDRPMVSGEAFSLRPIAGIINGLDYDRVVICDPHSDVTPALIERVRVVDQVTTIRSNPVLADILSRDDATVVAPDAGSTKKAFAVVKEFGSRMLIGIKHRDVKTGEITKTEVHDAWAAGKQTCVIVDDICDGGRTFVELAKVLRTHMAGKVYLYVTHGIFSKGLDVFDGLIDGVFTTNTFLSPAVRSADHAVPIHVSDYRLALGGVL